jgi:hypothetical protein
MAKKVIDIEIKPNLQGVRSLNAELSKMRSELDEATDPKQIQRLNKELKKTEKQLEDINDVTDEFNLSKKFDDVYKDTVPLSSRLGELEDRMYELAFAGKANTKEFKALQMEAVEMRQTIIGVDKQVDILADNRGFSVFGDGISEVGASLMRLDFETASQQAGTLAQNAGNISFGTAVKSVKQFGSTLINLGKAILANPLFLLVTIIVAIAVAIYELLDSLGIIKVIFEAVGAAIGFVVQMIKDFLDWIGLTNFAEQDAAEKSAKAAEKRAKAQRKASEKIIASLDHEIKMAELLGKSTEELTSKKLIEGQKMAKADLEASRKRLKAEKLKGDMDHDELVKLREKTDKARMEYQKSFKDIEYFNLKTKVERKKFNQEQRDNEALAAAQLGDDRVQGMIEQARIERDIALREANLTASQKLLIEQQYNDQVLQIQNDDRERRYNEYKAFRDSRIDAEREMQDIMLELMESGFDKEMKAAELNYERSVEDAKNNEELTQKERIKLIELYGKQRIEAEAKAEENRAEKKKEQDQKKLDEEQQRLDDLSTFYAKQDALEIELMAEGYDKQKAERTAQFEDRIAQLEAEGLLEAEIEKKIRQQLQDDLNAIDEQARKEREAAEEAEAERKKNLEIQKAQMAIDGLALVAGVAELFADKSERAAKIAFNIQKAASIAQATMDGYKAVLSTYANTPGGVVLKSIAAAIAGGFSAVQIAGIAKTKFEGGGGASGVQSAASGGGSTSSPAASPQSPSLELFGQANGMNTFFQSEGEEQNQTIQAVVSLDQLDTSKDKQAQIFENGLL